MERRQLGRTDLKVSSIGMGCVTFGREIDADSSFAIMDYALENGINLFDTAEAYAAGASEKVLGDWLTDRGCRDQIVLASKVTVPLGKQRIKESVENSLNRLNTDRIDLFQLHSWDDSTPLEETLETLTELVTEGKVRYVGCSNFQAWQLAKGLLLEQTHNFARLESVQPPYNLVQREIESDLLPLCQDQQVGVLSYSPLGAGFLTGKYRRDSEVPTGSRFDVIPGHQPIYFTNEGFQVMEQLEQLSNESGHSMIQLALAWVLASKDITSMLVGARNKSHLDQAFEAGKLSVAEDLADRMVRFT